MASCTRSTTKSSRCCENKPFYPKRTCKCRGESFFLFPHHKISLPLSIIGPHGNLLGLSQGWLGLICHCSVSGSRWFNLDPDFDITLLSDSFYCSDFSGVQWLLVRQTKLAQQFTVSTMLKKKVVLESVHSDQIFILRVPQQSKSTLLSTVRTKARNKTKIYGYKLVKLTGFDQEEKKITMQTVNSDGKPTQTKALPIDLNTANNFLRKLPSNINFNKSRLPLEIMVEVDSDSSKTNSHTLKVSNQEDQNFWQGATVISLEPQEQRQVPGLTVTSAGTKYAVREDYLKSMKKQNRRVKGSAFALSQMPCIHDSRGWNQMEKNLQYENPKDILPVPMKLVLQSEIDKKFYGVLIQYLPLGDGPVVIDTDHVKYGIAPKATSTAAIEKKRIKQKNKRNKKREASAEQKAKRQKQSDNSNSTSTTSTSTSTSSSSFVESNNTNNNNNNNSNNNQNNNTTTSSSSSIQSNNNNNNNNNSNNNPTTSSSFFVEPNNTNNNNNNSNNDQNKTQNNNSNNTTNAIEKNIAHIFPLIAYSVFARYSAYSSTVGSRSSPGGLMFSAGGGVGQGSQYAHQYGLAISDPLNKRNLFEQLNQIEVDSIKPFRDEIFKSVYNFERVRAEQVNEMWKVEECIRTLGFKQGSVGLTVEPHYDIDDIAYGYSFWVPCIIKS